MFDLQEQIPSTDSSELCFHFSLVTWHYPLESVRAKPSRPALPRREENGWANRHLAGACSSSSSIHHQYCFCSWWHGRLGTKEQEMPCCDYLRPPACTLVQLSCPLLSYWISCYKCAKFISLFLWKKPHFLSTLSKGADVSGSLTFLEGLWIRSSVWDVVCRASCNLLNRQNWCSLSGSGGKY